MPGSSREVLPPDSHDEAGCLRHRTGPCETFKVQRHKGHRMDVDLPSHSSVSMMPTEPNPGSHRGSSSTNSPPIPLAHLPGLPEQHQRVLHGRVFSGIACSRPCRTAGRRCQGMGSARPCSSRPRRTNRRRTSLRWPHLARPPSTCSPSSLRT